MGNAEMLELAQMLWRAAAFVRKLPEERRQTRRGLSNKRWAAGLARCADEAARAAMGKGDGQ